MATGDYTTVLDAKAHAEIPEDDTTRDTWLAKTITRVSRAIDKHCHRYFYPVTKSRVYDYQAGRKLFFKDDLYSITQILHGVDRAEVLSSSNYYLYPEIGPPYQWLEISEASTVQLQWSTLTFQQSIQITGVWGYLENGATPALISGACDAWISYLYKLGKLAGIKSTTIGDYSVSYSGVMDFLKNGPPNEVAGTLDYFVRRTNFASNVRSKG